MKILSITFYHSPHQQFFHLSSSELLDWEFPLEESSLRWPFHPLQLPHRRVQHEIYHVILKYTNRISYCDDIESLNRDMRDIFTRECLLNHFRNIFQ